jgi:hypothetical protein
LYFKVRLSKGNALKVFNEPFYELHCVSPKTARSRLSPALGKSPKPATILSTSLSATSTAFYVFFNIYYIYKSIHALYKDETLRIKTFLGGE